MDQSGLAPGRDGLCARGADTERDHVRSLPVAKGGDVRRIVGPRRDEPNRIWRACRVSTVLHLGGGVGNRAEG